MFWLFVLATAFFSHSLSMIGAEGWTVLDLFLPATFALCAALAIVRRQLTARLAGISLLPAAFFFLVLLHLFSDPRLDEILAQIASARLPTGGFRLYFSIGISVLLYYTAPLIITDEKRLRLFLRIYLGVILFQVVFTCLRVLLGIHHVPWDSYSSQIMSYDPNAYWGEGLRLIVLGDMGMHLFIFALVFMKPRQRWRMALLGLAAFSIIWSKGRAPFLASALVLFLYLIVEKRLWLPAFTFAGLLAAVLGVFAANPALLDGLPATPKRFLSVLSPDNPEYQTDTFSRMDMWKIQLHVIRRNPFWGSMTDLPPTANEWSRNAVMRGDTHGVYLGTAALFGVPALLLWLLIVARQGLRSYDLWKWSAPDSERRRLGLWLLLILSAYLFKYLTSGGAGGGSADMFLLFALADAAARAQQRGSVPARARAGRPWRVLPAPRPLPAGNGMEGEGRSL